MHSDDVASVIKTSSGAFVKHVWPLISDRLGGGELLLLERMQDNPLAEKMDRLCGVDIWQQVASGLGIRAIASRCQENYNYSTFTWRYEINSGNPTEYHKRINAIENGLIYPEISVHAYLNKDFESLIRVGVARTVNLAPCMQAAKKAGQIRRNGKDGHLFVWVNFKDVPGVEVIESGIAASSYSCKPFPRGEVPKNWGPALNNNSQLCFMNFDTGETWA